MTGAAVPCENAEGAVAVCMAVLLLLSEGLALCKRTECNSIGEFLMSLAALAHAPSKSATDTAGSAPITRSV